MPVDPKDPKKLRYESNQEWKKAKELDYMADEAMKQGDKDRANDFNKAAEELREDAEAKWDKSKM